MRVILEQECAAVAGGQQSECERNVELAGIATGAIIGGVTGAAAGGVGALPGAVGGAGVGSLVAQVVGPTLCRWAANAESDNSDEDQEIDPEIAADFMQQYFSWSQRPAFPNSHGHNPTGPHQLVVETSY